MHYIFATRGVQHARDMLVTQLQGLKFPRTVERKQKDGTWKEEKQIVWGQLRPIELWEFIFPEEYKDQVLTALGAAENINPWPLKIPQKVLQKAFGAKPVKYNKVEALPVHLIVPRSLHGNTGGISSNRIDAEETDGVAIYPIGIKEDVKGEWKEQNLKQEML